MTTTSRLLYLGYHKSMSRSYTEVIRSFGWHAFDITDDIARGSIRPWNELYVAGAAGELVIGSTYVLTPQPAEGQTQRDAYVATHGVGPALHVPDPERPEFAQLLMRFSPRLAVFSRITMETAGVRLHSIPLPDGTSSDMVLLAPETAQRTFEENFFIITNEDFQAEAALWAR